MTQIGIDLGTTNSLIAQFIDSDTRLIPNRLGHVLTPSAVSISDDDAILVGLAARERLTTAPHLTATAFKRFMGTDKIFKLGKRQFRAEELSALVLKNLKADAEEFLQESIKDVVITVPAYFNAVQRQATKNAAEMAGLNAIRLLNEPTAAGLAYGIQDKPDDTRFLIYDLGGGTFDISILNYFDGIVEVSASAGDNHLGGEDFVRVLRQCFQRKCPDADEKIVKSTELWQQLEGAKRTLSEENCCEVNFVHKGREYRANITRTEFEYAAAPLMQRLRQPMERALLDAKLKPHEINGIILVGGASRMPMVRNSIANLFKRIPLAAINPDEAIARGAAIQAALIKRNQSVEDVILTDVMPFSLGTQVLGGRFVPIIERNMPVPISRVESFQTVNDYQESINFGIYQGESLFAHENILLGEMIVTLPPLKAGKVNVNARFSYDVNGLLEVDISNEDLALKMSQVFHQNTNNLTAAEIEASRTKLSALKIHPREQQENIYLIEKAKRLYESHLGENRRQIWEALSRFLEVLDSQDNYKIKEFRRTFEDFLQDFDGDWLL